MNKAPRIALIAAACTGILMTTSACSSYRESSVRNPAPCPNIIVLNEAARLVEFDGEQQAEDIAWTGEIANVSLSCRYLDDKPIKASLNIDFALGKGPKAEGRRKDYTYFVAVTRRDLEVIAREEFTIGANFNRSRDIIAVREKIDSLVIPRASEKTSGTNFEVIVGFALTRQQAIYNRSGKSLKFPDLPDT